MLRFVFETLGQTSIYATCSAGNHRSARVLEKAGLTIVHRWMHRDDEMDIDEEHLRYRMERTDCTPRGPSQP